MFTHVDKTNRPKMVDVSEKSSTLRRAVAESCVVVSDEIMSHFKGDDIQTKKGPVFNTAIIAGTAAVKKTWDLIPFCHPLLIQGCNFKIHTAPVNRIIIQCEVITEGKTGVEMEALCGATVAALTVYDMCKALSHEMKIESTRLLEKQGGKSDYKEKN